MRVPFVDLHAQYLTIKPEIDQAISAVMSEAAFISGKYARLFEEQFAQFLGVQHFVSCANGTDSIEILLKGLNIGPGDEVIVPAVSWISTSEAVTSVGAVPVFADIEPDYYCINPKEIESHISSRTKAIIPVHLYGQPANMPEIMRLAKKHALKVIEDCAQAHGAIIDGRMVGTWGDAASFSFYPGKNLGAYGDSGGMATNDARLAETIRRIANHGQLAKHDHQIEGRNSRMDGIQAAVLSVKLPYLKEWTHRRIELATQYSEALTNSGVVAPSIRPNSSHVFHLYVIRTSERAGLQKKLEAAEVQTGIHYPRALPYLPCYSNLQNTAEDFPVAWCFQDEILSLPLYPEMQDTTLQKIVRAMFQ